MYGPPPASAPRPGGSSAGAVAVRVLLTVLAVVSLGFLAWVAMLRIAIMRRTGRDWALFWTQLLLNIACVVPLEQRFAGTWMNTAGMIALLVQMVAVVCYYLIVDTRHHHAPAPLPAPLPPAPAPVPGYGYPPAYPGTATTAPSPSPHLNPLPNPYAQPPEPRPYPPRTPPPAAPPSPRIDQVRAELDELSDLLRKEEGR
ncbi:hypothetical protein ACFZCF_28380 [Streptomyces sp. NPDC007945]|uniref:hypothetical protein n=1 Tax=Streptomyces sp. NPDC007945 TaxID=3364797 RepID=UPI0036ED6F40